VPEVDKAGIMREFQSKFDQLVSEVIKKILFILFIFFVLKKKLI